MTAAGTDLGRSLLGRMLLSRHRRRTETEHHRAEQLQSQAPDSAVGCSEAEPSSDRAAGSSQVIGESVTRRRIRREATTRYCKVSGEDAGPSSIWNPSR